MDGFYAPFTGGRVKQNDQAGFLARPRHRAFPIVLMSGSCDSIQGIQLREQLRHRTGFPSPERGVNVVRVATLPVMNDGGYDLRALDLDTPGIAAITGLLKQVFPNAPHFTEEVVHWQYVRNPDGHAVGFNAWKDGVLAAHYVTIPLLARVNGIEEKGLLSLNTATHPAHQGKGLFTKLANSTYADGAVKGYGFVIGVANANSTHGFTRKLGFQLVAPLQAMIGIGNLKMKETDGAHYERLWSEAALRWRLAHPAFHYHLKRTDELDFILSERTQFGASYVLGCFPKNTVGERMIPSRPSGVPFKIWIGRDRTMKWNSRPYMNIPMRFRPSPLNLIFKDLTGNGRTLGVDQVRFQAIDFDTL